MMHATSCEVRGGTVQARLFRCFVLAALLPSLLLPLQASALTPQIHTVVSGGVKFRHFDMELSASNTLLPDDPRIHRERLDDTSGNFDWGQFEVFIPVRELTLPTMTCRSVWIVRMATSEKKEMVADIQAKQALFFAIKKAVADKSGAVRVVIDLGDSGGCNLFFRVGPHGRYVDHVGPIQH